MSNDLFNKWEICNSTAADMDAIFSLFDSAVAYQQNQGYNLWPRFNSSLIETEIAEGRHWKIMGGPSIACVFSVLYNDPVIWRERDTDPAVYLHRIAVNPLFKGKRIMELIRVWAIQHARENGKKYVRMDTWGNNENLRNYYIRCGFTYIGQQRLDKPEAHYGGSELSLFQVEV